MVARKQIPLETESDSKRTHHLGHANCQSG